MNWLHLKSGPSWSAVNLQRQFTSLLKQDDVGELPAYMAAAEDVVIPTEEKKVGWWCGHEEQLPRSGSAVKTGSPCQTIVCKRQKEYFQY